MAGMYPLSRHQQFSENGELLVGARLFLFDGGTTTPRVGYRDSSLTTAHPNPIVADAAGRLPLVFLQDGFYRQRLTTASGVVVFDDDGIPVLSTTVAGTGTSVDPNATLKTRDIKIRFDHQPVDGYVRLNGRTIGSLASGATERANADTQSLYEELWTYSNIVVPGGKGASGPADFAANKPLALPNCAGRGIFGMDDMGAGPQGILTSTWFLNPTLVGSIGGQQGVTIEQRNLPVYTLTGGSSGNFTVSGTSGDDSPDHSHHINFFSGVADRDLNHTHGITIPNNTNTQAQVIGGASAFFWTGSPGTASATGGAIPTPGSSIDHLHRIVGDTGGRSLFHQHSFTWTGVAPNISIGSGGSGVAITNLPPIMTLMIYIRL
jgi:hypothetical protein